MRQNFIGNIVHGQNFIKFYYEILSGTIFHYEILSAAIQFCRSMDNISCKIMSTNEKTYPLRKCTKEIF